MKLMAGFILKLLMSSAMISKSQGSEAKLDRVNHKRKGSAKPRTMRDGDSGEWGFEAYHTKHWGGKTKVANLQQSFVYFPLFS